MIDLKRVDGICDTHIVPAGVGGGGGPKPKPKAKPKTKAKATAGQVAEVEPTKPDVLKSSLCGLARPCSI